MSKDISLVTGANGHLGNNLVRLLLSKNIKTKASVRTITNTTPFKGLDCELVQADLMDKDSLIKAFKGITNL
jgi:dihydroflavonol-4-reductase